MTLIFRMGQRLCHYCFCLWRKPMPHLLMFATNHHLGYPRCKAKIICALLTFTIRIGWWLCCVLFCVYWLPVCWLCITATKSHFNYRTYKTKNRWRCVDTHYNILSIQNLLPWIIGFIIIWNYWLAFCLIETQPFGKAEPSNIIALVALILTKFIHLAI